MTDTYDLVIDQHLSHGRERNNMKSLDDSQIIKIYKNKIERKRGISTSQQSPKYNVSRDFQVVFVKDPKKNNSSKINQLMKVLMSILKRRLIFGIRKIKENRFARQKSQSQWSISESDEKMPIDYKKTVEAFEDLDNLFKRKNQLSLVLGFIKISYEQKKIMKKREQLIRNLSGMRIQQVFSILRDFRLQKRSKGTQVELLNQIPCESVIQKIDSTATIFLDSFISKDKTKTFNNPFSKIKSDKIDYTTLNMEDSKVSQTSFQTINLKMNRLQSIIKEARQIRQSHNYKNRYSTLNIDEIQDRKPVSVTDLIHSCSEIKSCDSPMKKTKKNLNIRNFNNRNKDFSQINVKTNQNTKFNTFQSQTQQTKRIPKFSSPTSKTSSKIKTKIHQIVQPVIQQVIQPIYYHIPVYSYRQKSSYSTYEPEDIQYVKQTIYRPIFKHKSPDFSRVYPSTPKPSNGWF